MSVSLQFVFATVTLVLSMDFTGDARAQAPVESARPDGLVPAHDPPDIPFRRAPMGLASRSIVISLTTNLHLAFDATLLSTHTVWEGAPLNLYGPPFNDAATRFICDFTGRPLWGNLPVQPWEFPRGDGNGFVAAGTRFLGVSTRNGPTSFLYELIPAAGSSVQVRETPRAEQVGALAAVVRRFDVAPHHTPIRMAAFHGPGEIVPLAELENAVALRRDKDFLLVTARGLSRNALTASSDDADRTVLMQRERDGRGPYSGVLTNTVSGRKVKVTLELPLSTSAQAVEISTTVCVDQNEIRALAKALGALPVSRSNAAVASVRDNSSRPPDSFRGGAEFPLTRLMDKPAGDQHYTIEHFPVPKDIKLLVGGMDFLPNGDLAICTYAGEIWIVEGATGDRTQARWRRFARGLNEPGGLRVLDGDIYLAQKCELTRIADTDGNGEADLFECLSDGWGYTGNYHSFVTGPALDGLGKFYVLITGHRTIYDVPFMGWCLRISPGSLSPRFVTEGFCSGLRVPNGFGEFNGEIFMTDNQGHWIAANKLNHLQAGHFYGHPSARPAPLEQFAGDPQFTPPAVWFPYVWVRSASGITAVADERFGPFRGQMLVGEFQNASVVRVALEKVNGQWQGAVFPFVKGFASGVNRLVFGPDGRLYVGGLRMGHWTSIAPHPFSLDRVTFTGKSTFEIREVHAQPDGFTLTFTQPVDPASASDAGNWDAVQYTYSYDGRHNTSEKDRDEKVPGPPVHVTNALVSSDQLTVRLEIDGCQPRHVIMVRAFDVQSARHQELRHDTFHYTLNQIPGR